MSTQITRGKGILGRTYERLRKRSYRRLLPHGRNHWYNATRDLRKREHEAYVRGVHDALIAAEEIMEDLQYGR